MKQLKKVVVISETEKLSNTQMQTVNGGRILVGTTDQPIELITLNEEAKLYGGTESPISGG